MTAMKIKNLFLKSLLGIAVAGGLASCASDDPFSKGGEGTVRLRMVINSDVTRAETDDDALRQNCVVYISNTKGLIHKYQGLENLPETLPMKSGQYVAEAWTGDSVPASFDKKFYRCYQPFTVTTGVNSVVMNCKIANVVASVNSSSIDPEVIKDWKITVSSSTGSLDFTEENVEDSKGYFMMPFDESSKSYESSLTYVITGSNATGKEFTKTGVISDVKKAHEYSINLEYHPEYQDIGGSFITVTIDESEVLIRSEVEILSAPSIKGVDFDITKQFVGEQGGFHDIIVKVSNFGGLHFLRLQSDDYMEFGLPQQEVGLMMLTDYAAEELHNCGLLWDVTENISKGTTMTEVYLTADMLNRLKERDSEYVINFEAVDEYGKTTVVPLRIAVGEAAVIIEDPVKIADPVGTDMTAVRSTSMTLPLSLAADDVVNPGLRFREAGTEEWTTKTLAQMMNRRRVPTRAGSVVNITLSNLKPSTRYEIQAIANDGEFVSESLFITTEGCFVIPNAGMEEWSNFVDKSSVRMPSADGTKSFWDTGNHGSKTLSSGPTLTDGTSDIFHNGSLSAKLQSHYVLVKFAAGNLFAGEYVRTDGTDGVLSFGRPYDGSHPAAMRVFVNYRPDVANKGGKSGYIAKGELDKGQIYVALSTQPVEIETKNSKKLFNKDDAEILAYGEYTFESDYGDDGQMKEVRIPFNYNERAKTNKPLYLIIVCTASKYGDYFSGGDNSVMYVDDFELIYE